MFSSLNVLAGSKWSTCTWFVQGEGCAVSIEDGADNHLPTPYVPILSSLLEGRLSPVASPFLSLFGTIPLFDLPNTYQSFQRKAVAYNGQNLIQRNVIWMAVPFILVLIIMTIRLNSVRKKLARSMEEVDRQNQQLRAMDEKRKELLSILGHDLRSPIWAIRQYLELNQNPLFKGESKMECHREALASAINLQGTLEELLEWSSDKECLIVPRSEFFQLRTSVDFVLNSIKLMAIHKEVELINAICPSIQVNSDNRMVSIVLRNVVVNAVKFSSGGNVRLSAYRQRKVLHVVVEDNGVGMDPDQLRAIQTMGRVDSMMGTKGERGLGLGISAALKYVHRLGGEMQFESELGKGTRVFISGFELDEKSADKKQK
ncbi:MAG: HAMP domain-containing histidine kinase [Bacteroidetes bacterium]|nr:MAG: HAMP domain-containing histidine kinase [Bacteroidota bacterium]